MKIKFGTVIFLSISVTLLFIAIVNVATLADPYRKESYGTVIGVDEPMNKIEVRIEEDGPRIYIDDFGTHSLSDFQYGDILDLEFYNHRYHVIDIREE